MKSRLNCTINVSNLSNFIELKFFKYLSLTQTLFYRIIVANIIRNVALKGTSSLRFTREEIEIHRLKDFNGTETNEPTPELLGKT